MRVVPLGTVEGNPLLEMLSGWGKFSQVEQGWSQSRMGPYQEGWIPHVLSQMQKLFSQLT